MQINSSRPADFYPLAPADNRNTSRLPVVFDAGSELKPIASQQRADNTTIVVPATRNQDSQQARFVRDFISSERKLDDESNLPPFLPRAVQQYLYVNEIPTQNSSGQGQLLDEMV